MEKPHNHMTLEEARDLKEGDKIIAVRTDEKAQVTESKMYYTRGSVYFPNIKDAMILHFNDGQDIEKVISTIEDRSQACSSYTLFRKAI